MAGPQAWDAADKVMQRAYQLADAKSAHDKAVREFANDQGEYSEVEATSKGWTEADEALRKAVNDLIKMVK